MDKNYRNEILWLCRRESEMLKEDVNISNEIGRLLNDSLKYWVKCRVATYERHGNESGV